MDQQDPLAEMRLRLEELETENRRARELIDALRHRITQLEGAAPPGPPGPPPPPGPLPPSPPPSGTPSAEQRALRVVAAIGGIITAMGVTLAVIWAHDRGVLGPVGITVFGALSATVLAGAGFFSRLRGGDSAGVTALFSASFLAAAGVLVYINMEIFSGLRPVTFALAFFAVWLLYVALAWVVSNTTLLTVMLAVYILIIAVPVSGYLVGDAAVLLAPVAAAAAVSFPRGRPFRDPWVVFALASAGLLVCTALAIYSAVDGPQGSLIPHVVVCAVATAALVGVSARPSTTPPRTLAALALVAFPAISLAFVLRWADDVFSPWVTVAVAFGLSVYLGRTRALPVHASWWLAAAALATARAREITLAAVRHSPFEALELPASLITLAAYIALFCGAALVLRGMRRSSGDSIAAPAWVLGFALCVSRSSSWIFVEPMWAQHKVPVLAEAPLVAAFLAACVAWRGLSPRLAAPARVAAGVLLAILTVHVIHPPVATLAAALPGVSDAAAFWVGHAVTSVVWIMVSGALLLTPWARRWGSTSLSAGVLFAVLAAVKLVTTDLEAAGDVTRVVAFLVCGSLLLAASVVRTRQDREESGTPPTPGPRGGTHP